MTGARRGRRVKEAGEETRMPKPEECLYTREHEWVWSDGDEIRIGVTEFAQGELGEVIYVELKDVGAAVAAGEEIGTIESVKAVAEVYAPVAGEIVARNEGLADKPETINEAPLGDGWLVRMRPADRSELEGLMDHAAYARYLEDESH